MAQYLLYCYLLTLYVGQTYTKIDNEYTQQVVRDITLITHFVYCCFDAY